MSLTPTSSITVTLVQRWGNLRPGGHVWRGDLLNPAQRAFKKNLQKPNEAKTQRGPLRLNNCRALSCAVLPEPMLNALLRRMPALESAEIHQLVNCPESFTPDMRCLMGETPGVSGYYVLAGMNSSGLSFAGGAGK